MAVFSAQRQRWAKDAEDFFGMSSSSQGEWGNGGKSKLPVPETEPSRRFPEDGNQPIISIVDPEEGCRSREMRELPARSFVSPQYHV